MTVIQGETVVAGQTYLVASPNTLDSPVVENGGFLEVGSAGVASGATIQNGGYMFVSYGIASGTVIERGGIEDIFGVIYGIDTNTEITSYGSQAVFGGEAVSATVAEGGVQLVEQYIVSHTNSTVAYFPSVADGTVLSHGGQQLVVGAYTTATATDVKSGGELLVTSGTFGGGASVFDPHVESGGVMILEQSVASGATIDAGATVLLLPERLAAASTLLVDPTIAAGATIISTGVVLVGEYITITNGVTLGIDDYVVDDLGVVLDHPFISAFNVQGSVDVLPGGTLIDPTFDNPTAFQTIRVESGGALVSTYIAGGIRADIGIYGTAIADTLINGGQELLEGFEEASNPGAGAVSYYDRLSGGQQTVMGTAISAYVPEFGIQFVTSEGFARDSTVTNSGLIEADEGSVASALVTSQGSLTASNGGNVEYTTLVAGGVETIGLNGGDVGALVSGGGTEVVSYGGFSQYDGVSSGGLKILASGGHGLTDTIFSRGVEEVEAFGVLSQSVVQSGGTLLVYGTILNIAVEAGGTEIAYTGANLTISSTETLDDLTLSGASANIPASAVAEDVTIGPASQLNVAHGGFALDDLVSGGTGNGQGAYQNVSGQATATNIGSLGVEEVQFGGTASMSVVSSSGVQGVGNSGVSMSTTVMMGGEQEVDNSGNAFYTVVSGGHQRVADGAVATKSLVFTGGELDVAAAETIFGVIPGGTAVSAHVFGVMSLGSAAVADFTSVGNGGTVTNAGTLTSTYLSNGGTMTDGGFGTSGALSIATMIGSGATEFVGFHANDSFAVISSGGTQVLDQGTITGASVLAGGIQVTDEGTIAGSETFAAGATLLNSEGLVLNGAIADIPGTFENDADATLDPSALTVGHLTGSGDLSIGAGSVFEIGSDAASTDRISFAGAGAVLRLDQPAGMAATIAGFTIGDTIDLAGFASAGLAPGTDSLTVTSGSSSATFTFTSGTDLSHLTVSPDAAGTGSDVVAGPACFVRGTRLRTAGGDVPVEALSVGDTLRTIDGADRPIIWIGHRRVDFRRHPDPAQVHPVRIAADAFAPGVPARDVFLSADHAVYVDAVLIPIGRLVNGHTIRHVPVETVDYFHVELAQHDVALADGLPVETYLDTDDRASFGDGPVVTLHPAWGRARHDVGTVWDALGYAPLRLTGPEVARVQARLAPLAGKARRRRR